MTLVICKDGMEYAIRLAGFGRTRSYVQVVRRRAGSDDDYEVVAEFLPRAARCLARQIELVMP